MYQSWALFTRMAYYKIYEWIQTNEDRKQNLIYQNQIYQNNVDEGSQRKSYNNFNLYYIFVMLICLPGLKN